MHASAEDGRGWAQSYFGKRYLSPQLGRWLSADPLAIHAPGRADFNLYAYVSGAVLKAVDPLGLDAAWIVFKGADEFHDAALARATNWAKEGSGRHVVVVSASPKQETMDKAWSDAAAKAGEGGKVILTGHGAAYEDGQSSWVLQLAAAKRDATQNPYRVTADELNPDKGHGIKATSSEKIDQYFANASEQLSKHGVRDVEVFACNIGKNEKQIADLARRFQTRTTAYKAFVGVDDAGQSTGLSREEHGPSIKGSESKGLPSETEAGVGYTEVYDPIPELTGQAAGAAAYEASMKVHGE